METPLRAQLREREGIKSKKRVDDDDDFDGRARFAGAAARGVAVWWMAVATTNAARPKRFAFFPFLSLSGNVVCCWAIGHSVA